MEFVYIILGAVVIFAVIGVVFGLVAGSEEGKPIEGAATGAETEKYNEQAIQAAYEPPPLTPQQLDGT